MSRRPSCVHDPADVGNVLVEAEGVFSHDQVGVNLSHAVVQQSVFAHKLSETGDFHMFGEVVAGQFEIVEVVQDVLDESTVSALVLFGVSANKLGVQFHLKLVDRNGVGGLLDD